MPESISPGHELRALCWRLLGLLHGPVGEALNVVVEDGVNRIVVRLERANAPPRDEPRYPGRFFSSTELLIWRALEDGPLISRDIADAIGQDHSSKLRNILSNLEDRGVVHNDDDRQGYRRAECVDSADPKPNSRVNLNGLPIDTGRG